MVFHFFFSIKFKLLVEETNISVYTTQNNYHSNKHKTITRIETTSKGQKENNLCLNNVQTLQKFFWACSIVTVGIFPFRIKFTVLLLSRHCRHVSNAKYGHTALKNYFSNQISVLLLITSTTQILTLPSINVKAKGKSAAIYVTLKFMKNLQLKQKSNGKCNNKCKLKFKKKNLEPWDKANVET